MECYESEINRIISVDESVTQADDLEPWDVSVLSLIFFRDSRRASPIIPSKNPSIFLP